MTDQEFESKPSPSRRDWLVNYIAIIVTTIWAVTLIVGMVNPNYEPPVAIYPALLAVVGGVFGFRLTKKDGE